MFIENRVNVIRNLVLPNLRNYCQRNIRLSQQQDFIKTDLGLAVSQYLKEYCSSKFIEN